MAEVDDYLRLRELDGLLKQASEEARRVEDELNRLKKLDVIKAEREGQLKTAREALRESQHQLAEVDRKLGQHLGAEAKERLEQQGLDLLIREQELDQVIDEHQTFLGGFAQTLKEIQAEVSAAVAEARTRQESSLLRARLLEEALPEDWRRAYQKALARKPAHGPFSRIENGHCLFCRGAISRIFESEVEAQLLLKACPSCGRLFLPHKAVYG